MDIETRAACSKCGRTTAHTLIDFVIDKAIVECRECLCVSMRSRRDVFQDSDRKKAERRPARRLMYMMAL